MANQRHDLADLNQQQLQAVRHGDEPLLIIAGAGTGKTNTLVHRVAHLIERGISPDRILLLTFTRRASAEMLRRVEGVIRQLQPSECPSRPNRSIHKVWGGTFHAIAARLLRMHGPAIGLDQGFTIHDRADSEDLLDVVRTANGLAKHAKRFPKKGTCLAIYSHCVNSRNPLERVLQDFFPWCQDFAKELKQLFQQYVDRKEQSVVLDYDDLLLFWHALLEDSATAQTLQAHFDCVLVDEYQDTNHLQAEILRYLCPSGRGLTVVGDDAQSIYSFRAASVRNILDFPQLFPHTTVVRLEQNYRSTQPILAVTNAVIREASQRYDKELWSTVAAGEQPELVLCHDEHEQTDFLVRQILDHREEGVDLRKQAVLFRASHHSIVLEAELGRHNIPFVKYGGLRFTEAAHIKDLLAFLRLAENPRDVVAGMRILGLLPGVGPKKSEQLLQMLAEGNFRFEVWKDARLPGASENYWTKLVALLLDLAGAAIMPLAVQIQATARFYSPLLDEIYDHPDARRRDLEQLEQVATRFTDRRTLLADITLDPPATTEDFARDPLLDEDYLILSTIHSAKGLEWEVVYVIHASDGNIPADMATKNQDQVEEERRLFYVALTRAKRWLSVCCPQRYYQTPPGSFGDRYGFAQLTRFIPAHVRSHFRPRVAGQESGVNALPSVSDQALKHQEVRQRLKSMWN